EAACGDPPCDNPTDAGRGPASGPRCRGPGTHGPRSMPRSPDPMAALAADRNLLFGLLALQNGLINQVQLVAAFQAWTLDKARALADHLLALGHLNDSQRKVVDALAELHVAKHGDVEHSLAALPVGRSTRESLAQLADPDIEGSLAQVGSASS